MELVLLHLPISLYASHDVQVYYIQHNFRMTMNMRFPIHTLIGLVPNNNMNERMNYVG